MENRSFPFGPVLTLGEALSWGFVHTACQPVRGGRFCLYVGFLTQIPKDNYLPLNSFAHFGLYFPSFASKENPGLCATLSCPSSEEQQSPNLSELPLTGVFKFYPIAPRFLQN